MQQVLITFRFYWTGTSEQVFGDSVLGVSVFATCTVIHKVSRAIAKQKEHFLSSPENLADNKIVSCNKQFLGGVRKLLYSWLSSFFVIFASFPRITSTSVRAFPPLLSLASRTLQIMFFLGLEFQPPSASLDLVHFPFDSTWKLTFLQRFIVVYLFFLLLGILFPIPPSLLKLLFDRVWVTTSSNREMYIQVTLQTMLFLVRHCLAIDWKKHDSVTL